jgi:hypothetical protein
MAALQVVAMGIAELLGNSLKKAWRTWALIIRMGKTIAIYSLVLKGISVDGE